MRKLIRFARKRTKNERRKNFRKSSNPGCVVKPHLNVPRARVGINAQRVRTPKKWERVFIFDIVN